MDICSNIVIGIISGIISSFIVLLVMYLLKPRLIIANKISILRTTGETIYRVKIVNKTKAILTDVRYTLHYCIKYGDGVVEFSEIEPRKPPLTFIDKFDKKCETADYAVRFSYNINADRFPLTDNAFLLFTIYTKHSLSGALCCIKREYTFKDIVEGPFETGTSTKVVMHHLPQHVE